MVGEHPDTGKGKCRWPRGKRRSLNLKSSNKSCYGWNLVVWGRMEIVERLHRREKISNKEDFICASQWLAQR